MTLTPTDIQCMAAGYPRPVPGYEWVFDPHTFEPWQRMKDMTDRAELIDALAAALQQASRASVAKGAQFVQGEQINLDTESLWHAVATGVASIIDRVVDETVAKLAKDVDHASR